MPPAQTDTSVREMTQRLLEQFRGDIRARAQRPPPEQKRKELEPPPPRQPPELPASGATPPPPGVSPVATTLMGAPSPVLPPLAPLAPVSTPAPPTAAPPSAAPPTVSSPVASTLMGAPAPVLPPLATLGAGSAAAFAQKPVAPSLPSVGEELTLERGGKATVLAQEGDPGAAAFRVKTVERELLLRWRATPAPASRETLQRAAREGMPHGALLWPVDLATSSKAAGFGCLSPLPSPSFLPLASLLAGAPSPLRPRVTAALHLAEATLALHAAGWHLRGLSLKDVFFDPSGGEARLAGWDRILGIVEGTGSGELLAPEARGGQKVEGPYADLHALAVLQFCLIYQHFPFAGRKALGLPAGEAALDQLAASPVFLFDPARRENEAVPLAQDATGRAGGRAIALWESTLGDVKSLFSQAFGDGLRNPPGRPGASSWRLALGKLRDALYPCAHCTTDNVYDLVALKARGGAPGGCIHCGRELVLPARMKVGKHVLVLPAGSKIYRHHVEIGRSIGSDAVAEVSCHPQKPEILGIKNVSGQTWSIQWPDGKLLPLEPGKTIKLENGLKIQFGQQEGEVRR